MEVFKQHHADLQNIFHAGISAVHPQQCIPQWLQWSEQGLKAGGKLFHRDQFHHLYVTGAGKASAAMAAACENILGEQIHAGIIAVKEHHDLPLQYIRQTEAGHPVANNNSVRAAEQMIELAQGCTRNDLVILLWSGGASALLTDVPAGITLEELNHTIRTLSDKGAPIRDINTVRKHLSGIKGGQLAQHFNGATVIALVISDVIGSDLSVIGSGPVFPDDSTFQQALDIINFYELQHSVSGNIIHYLQKGIKGEIPETPKTGDNIFTNISHHIIAENRTALEAAKQQARKLGYEAHILYDNMQGDVELAAEKWIENIRSFKRDKKICLIAGGETTVNIRGNGKGGRNQHFALAVAIALRGEKNISTLAAGTDGTDGPTDAAGAIVHSDTVQSASEQGLVAEDFLARNDAWSFFDRTGALLKTGATQTNVMDIVITLM